MPGKEQKKRVYVEGNYCGHDKHEPKFTLAKPLKKGKGGLPRILTLALERFHAYYANPSLFPSLNHANGSHRQQRSERREAIVVLMAVLLKYTDVASLRVGIPGNNGFSNLSLDWLAKQTGLSHDRAKRAWADLRSSAIISSTQYREKDSDGNWIGHNSVKCFSKSFFSALGLGRMLAFERKKASKRLYKKIEAANAKPNLSGKARFALYTSMLGNRIASEQKRKCNAQKPSQAPPDELSTEERKKLSQIKIRLKAENPDLSREERNNMALLELAQNR